MKVFLITAAFAATVLVVHGELFSFSAITTNEKEGSAQHTGEAQLRMDVASLSAGQVSLIFTNAGPAPSVISSIYFDFAPELSLSLAAIDNGTGVDFQTRSGKSRNLPAGKDLDNIFISDLSVTAKSPSPKKGINPYESLALVMNYDTSYDLLAALENEELRVGLHVQGFAGGYSESFINVHLHQDAVPEPGTTTMLLIGGFVLRWLRIR